MFKTLKKITNYVYGKYHELYYYVYLKHTHKRNTTTLKRKYEDHTEDISEISETINVILPEIRIKNTNTLETIQEETPEEIQEETQDETPEEIQEETQDETLNETPEETPEELQEEIPNETQNETQNETSNETLQEISLESSTHNTQSNTSVNEDNGFYTYSKRYKKRKIY